MNKTRLKGVKIRHHCDRLPSPVRCPQIRFVSGFINEVVVGQWSMRGGSSAVSLVCIIFMCFAQRFLAASFAFGSFFLFFYPHPSFPFLFPLINQCDKCLARIYQGLAYSRRSVSRVRCSDDGERVKSYAEETRGRK